MTTSTRRHSCRIQAAFLVAALALALAFTSITTAEAAQSANKAANKSTAQRTQTFSEPTDYTFVGARCEEVQDGVYDVYPRFKVSGGRYANLGNAMTGYTHNDNVYRGGKRTVVTKMRVYGWPSDDLSDPVDMMVPFSHTVAPIATKENRSTWINTFERPVVNLVCE